MIRVLLALDESVASFRAAREAARLFRTDAEYLVVNVAQVPVPWVPVGGFGVVSVPLPAWDADDPGLFTEPTCGSGPGKPAPTPSEVLTPLGDPVELHLRSGRRPRCGCGGRRSPRQRVPPGSLTLRCPPEWCGGPRIDQIGNRPEAAEDR